MNNQTLALPYTKIAMWTHLEFLANVLIPISMVIMMVSVNVYPKRMEELQVFLQVRAFNNHYCTINTKVCGILDPKYGNASCIKQKYFDRFEMFHIHFFVFKVIDNWILQTLETPLIRKSILAFEKSFNNKPLDWEVFLQDTHVVVAMIFYAITGVLRIEFTTLFVLEGIISRIVLPLIPIVEDFWRATTGRRTKIY